MDGGGVVTEPGLTSGGVGGTAANPGGQLQLTQVSPAGGKYATPYFGLYTNSGDQNGAIPAVEGNQRVRLVDPRTGEVLVEGTGMTGAQQIATLANSISGDMGRKAAWQVQYEFQPDQFTTVGYDRADPKHNLLKTIVQIAGPLLGAAIPGLAPALGAALGGFGSTLATGGNLKQALLSAATSGIGNSAGSVLSSVLKGAPVGSAITTGLRGTNPLSGITGALTGGGAPATSLTDLGFGPLAAGYGGTLANALSGLGTVAPLTVTAAGAPSVLSTALSGAGSAVGGLTGTQVPGTPGGTAPTDVEGVTVTADPSSPGVPLPGVGLGGGGGAPDVDPGSSQGGGFDKNTLLDLLGQTGGQIGADLGVYGLAQILGLLPGGGRTDGMQTLTAPGYDSAPDTGTLGANPSGPGTPAPAAPSASYSAARDATGGTTALTQALGAANFNGGTGGAGAPLASAPTFNRQGSVAPDIYPWRRAQVA